jgi:hypothetical protein
MMEKLETRFQYCDSRFLPYLAKVLQRVPLESRERILKDAGFQIMAEEGFHDACVLRHFFESPVQTLVYLNTKVLREPEHRILLAIASQMAYYEIGKKTFDADSSEAEKLLMKWGFGEELDAVRYDQVIAETEDYKIGYKWARSQNKSYLLQHFGLYFDEWNSRSRGKASNDLPKSPDRPADAVPILEKIARLKAPGVVEAGPRVDKDTVRSHQAITAGIMAAIKEMELLERYSPQACEIYPV